MSPGESRRVVLEKPRDVVEHGEQRHVGHVTSHLPTVVTKLIVVRKNNDYRSNKKQHRLSVCLSVYLVSMLLVRGHSFSGSGSNLAREILMSLDSHEGGFAEGPRDVPSAVDGVFRDTQRKRCLLQVEITGSVDFP